MAERRMFTKKITESDAFLDMPASTQALYFHLSMNADDDGFINRPKSIQRTVGASDDDMKLLLAKRFIISFDTGIIVIKHWKMHNYIQSDRYKPTDYIEEKSMLQLDEKKAYTLGKNELDTECIQTVYIGKDRLGKDRLGKDRLYKAQNAPEYFPENEKLNEAFKDYVSMRKKIKAPMTDKAIELAIKKLSKMGDEETQIEILNQSVMNSWKGLFPLKNEQKSESIVDSWLNA